MPKPKLVVEQIKHTGTEAELLALVRVDPWAIKNIATTEITEQIAVAAAGSNVHGFRMIPKEMSLIVQAVRQLMNAARAGIIDLQSQPCVKAYIESRGASNPNAFEDLLRLARLEIDHEASKSFLEISNLVKALSPSASSALEEQFKPLRSVAESIRVQAVNISNTADIDATREAINEVAKELFSAGLDQAAVDVRAIAKRISK